MEPIPQEFDLDFSDFAFATPAQKTGLLAYLYKETRFPARHEMLASPLSGCYNSGIQYT